ncbi:MAG: hypothetical protein ACRCZJ_04400 [Erysipelotrichaceae bacterium]
MQKIKNILFTTILLGCLGGITIFAVSGIDAMIKAQQQAKEEQALQQGQSTLSATSLRRNESFDYSLAQLDGMYERFIGIHTDDLPVLSTFKDLDFDVYQNEDTRVYLAYDGTKKDYVVHISTLNAEGYVDRLVRIAIEEQATSENLQEVKELFEAQSTDYLTLQVKLVEPNTVYSIAQLDALQVREANDLTQKTHILTWTGLMEYQYMEEFENIVQFEMINNILEVAISGNQ